MAVPKTRIYDLMGYLNFLWEQRENAAINIVKISSLNNLNHNDISITQSDLKAVNDYKFDEFIVDLETIENLKKWCAFHSLCKYRIERVGRIIRPVGSVKKPQLSGTGYLISQFRWFEDDTTRSKNLPPGIYDIVSLAVSRGDTVKQIIKLIENGGDREQALGSAREWVIPWELELLEQGLID